MLSKSTRSGAAILALVLGGALFPCSLAFAQTDAGSPTGTDRLAAMNCADFSALASDERVGLMDRHFDQADASAKPGGPQGEGSDQSGSIARLRKPMKATGGNDTQGAESLYDEPSPADPAVAEALRAVGSYCASNPDGMVVDVLDAAPATR